MRFYEEWTGKEAAVAGAKKWRIFWWSYAVFAVAVLVQLMTTDPFGLQVLAQRQFQDALWALGGFAFYVSLIAFAVSELVGLIVFRLPILIKGYTGLGRLMRPTDSLYGFVGTIALVLFYLFYRGALR